MYEKAIQFFKLASKVNPNAYTAEIHYAKCYYKLGRFPESFKAFKKIHNKYPDNKEALTFLIENARQLNLPYNDYVKELNRIDQEQMTLDGYGQGGYDNMGGYSDDYYGQQPMYNSDYKGERVDFSAYSSKNNTAPKKEINQFMKFNPNQSPDELLP